MTNESYYPIKLLLRCLRLETPEKKSQALTAYTPADWENVLDAAHLHGVQPLLAWHLSRLPEQPSLPQNRYRELQHSLLNCAGRNIQRFHDLDDILSRLAKIHTPVILLKGAHLAKFVYPHAGLRPMGDLDLLIPQGRLGQAHQALVSMGYTAKRNFFIQRERKTHHHLPPYHRRNRIVELHWTIASPLSPLNIDLEGLWQRARPAPGHKPPAWLLSPEDLLLHLSLHLLQDEFSSGIRRIYDIAQALDYYQAELDWEMLASRARQWGNNKGLFLILLLSAEWYNAPLPNGYLESLQPPDFTPQIERLALQRALSVARPSKLDLHPNVARLWRRQPLRRKVAALFHSLFPAPEIIAQKYHLQPNTPKVYWYYGVRMKDLLAQYGGQVRRLLSGDPQLHKLAAQENLLSDWCLKS
jgi:hypothetical protein